jgi:hypothetical protein
MRKIMMIMAITLSMNIMPKLGLNMNENGMEFRDTFRIYVTNPIKV